jgi:hypothetical protein
MDFNADKNPSVLLDYAYHELEDEFLDLLYCDDLDRFVTQNPLKAEKFNAAVDDCLSDAFENNEGYPDAHLFIQRLLYRINRLKLFWYDELDNYTNENSTFLFLLRLKVENVWQDWESKKLIWFNSGSPIFALQERVKEDVQPEPSSDGLFIRDKISKLEYQHLLAITSIDGLVEASQLSRMLGGVGNEVQTMLTRILWEEYGSGKLNRKHSSHFATMLDACNLNSTPEAYFDIVPWEVLANFNHSCFLSERKRKYLYYIGGLLYTEVSVPAAFDHIKAAGERLKVGERGISYWAIHIAEDIRHGQWMLDDVVLPLVEKYRKNAWEIVQGYDQQKLISTRSTSAIVKSIRLL